MKKIKKWLYPFLGIAALGSTPAFADLFPELNLSYKAEVGCFYAGKSLGYEYCGDLVKTVDSHIGDAWKVTCRPLPGKYYFSWEKAKLKFTLYGQAFNTGGIAKVQWRWYNGENYTNPSLDYDNPQTAIEAYCSSVV